MKRFIKYTFLALIIVASLGLSGCTKQGQQRQRKQKFQVVSLAADAPKWKYHYDLHLQIHSVRLHC